MDLFDSTPTKGGVKFSENGFVGNSFVSKIKKIDSKSEKIFEKFDKNQFKKLFELIRLHL